MSQTDSTSASASGDPFAGLHKMSTTAGLGSGDYAAINPTAVAAMFLGVGSSLSLMIFEPLLLIIPLAGLICAVIAIVQIRRSNGTQTGKGWAWAGLVLSALFTLLVGGRHAMAIVEERSERQAVADLINNITAAVTSGTPEPAYELFSDRFHERVPLDEFTQKWHQMNPHPLHGRLTKLNWNNRLQIDADPATQTRYARLLLVFSFEKSPDGLQPLDVILRRTPQGWRVEDISALFPRREGPPGGPGGPQGPPG